jgi:uncharacterized phage infection (PIP) family protein YhgE
MPTAPVYYTNYQNIAPPPNFPSQGFTFGQNSQAFYRPVETYDGFFDIFGQARDSVIAGIENIYSSLTGVEATYEGSNVSSTGISPSLFETRIGESNTVSAENQIGDARAETTSENASLDTEAEARIAVQQVQNSLRTLNAAITALKKPSGHSSSTSPIVTNEASTTLSVAKIPNEAITALKTAEARVTRLQQQLEEGLTQLDRSNAKVKELTAELHALNQRIQAVNHALEDPTVSAVERENLIGALLTNIRLSLENAEERLEEAVAEAPPQTIGEVMREVLGGSVAEIVQWIKAALAAIFGGFSTLTNSS